jgi:hypothetical protein
MKLCTKAIAVQVDYQAAIDRCKTAVSSNVNPDREQFYRSQLSATKKHYAAALNGHLKKCGMCSL